MTDHYGFTGTRKGMTVPQREQLQSIFAELKRIVLHHGDCVGADEQAHRLAKAQGFYVALHPPTNPRSRAFCEADEVYDTLPYVVRNHKIVEMSDQLLAAPRLDTPELRSGTWATIRYAKRLKRPVRIIFPNGSIREE